MKSVVPEPVIAAGEAAFPEVGVAFAFAPVAGAGVAPGFDCTKAEAGKPPRVSASTAFKA
jgi:hypothetical protein